MKLITIAIIAFGLLPVTTHATYSQDHTIKCQNAFIGYEYNSKLDHTCHLKWKMWTRSILNNK